ncbi:MAG TPA: replication initiator [Mycobacteriales bacterium]|nr:replication initiator [Mycobacteriales bacterium]
MTGQHLRSGSAALAPAAPTRSGLVGRCTRPVVLVGRTDTIDPATGAVVATVDSDLLPGGRLLVPCGDRRAAVCPSCAKVYQADTYQLVRAGLAGGKTVPATVAAHPAVFATLTPPSFGTVHARRTDPGGQPRACRPRRTGPVCEHGAADYCWTAHRPDDPAVGQPLCPGCWDYPGAALWQAHAGRLWAATVLAVRRRLARLAGIAIRRLPALARVSFVRVAEFQRRGLIHLHTVIRVDGPSGPDDPPPAWAGIELLTQAVQAAHATAVVATPYSRAYGELEARWGPQLDVQPIPADGALPAAGGPVGRRAVAAYLAKYATKSTHDAGISLGRIRRPADLDAAGISPHARQLALTCWRLGALPEYRHLRLRAWAHALGWRGHSSTRSRRYSTTLTALRQARAEHQASERAASPEDSRPQGVDLVLERDWRYVGRAFPVRIGGMSP